jgi:hypothetical protein
LDRDLQTESGENYVRGVVEAERRAQEAGAGLQAADQDAKNQLLAMVQSGLDATTAATQSSQAMRANLAAAKASATANAFGDLFGGFADLYRKSQDRKQYNLGLQDTRSALYPSAGGAQIITPYTAPAYGRG